MLEWDGYQQALLARIGDLGRLTPQTVRGYRGLSDAANKWRIWISVPVSGSSGEVQYGPARRRQR